MPKNNKRSRPFLDTVILIIGLGLICFGGFYLWQWYSHTSGTAAPPKINKVVTHSTDTPDERPVPQNSDYNVAADQPKKIIIPSIAVGGFIQPVGKDQYDHVGVPTNIHFAGWYVKSAKPGDPGLSVIDGHVSSLYGAALFAKLKNLQGGDEVQIQFGDDSTRHFEVIDKRQLPESKTGRFLLTKRDDVDQQLNLVTCGGVFNRRSDKYNDRLVVVTKLINRGQ